MATTICTVMFCIQDTHTGDEHTDATGYVWREATPAHEVIAHVLTVQPDADDWLSDRILWHQSNASVAA